MQPGLSSLDRFLLQKAPQILAFEYGERQYTFQFGLGSAFAAIGVFMLVTGFATGVTGIWAGSIGPMIAGFVNMAVAQAMKHRFGAKPSSEAEMSPEARDFLVTLTRQTVGLSSIFPQLGFRHRQRWARRMGVPTLEPTTQRRAEEVLEPQLFQALDAAAAEHNRIFGIIESSKEDPSVNRMASSIRLAADEAMYDVLHQAAALAKYPENATVALEACRRKTTALKEVGERLTSLKAQALPMEAPAHTTMDSVLESLRLEQLAREELRPSEPPQEENLQQGL